MMRHFLESQLRDFNDNALIRVLQILAAAAMLVILYGFVFSGFQIVDEFEHLHASWLVSIGKIPYRDFFEHHHPLLWYLSAPLVAALYDNAVVFYVMRSFSFGISLLTVWYIYKFVLLFNSKSGAWLAVALMLGNLITIYNFYQFRPDNFMNCSFIIGLYYWFCYLQQKRLRLLAYSFVGFTISVLFLQKISLLLIVIEVLLLGLIFLKKTTLKDVFFAALPSVGVLALFFGFIFYQGIFLEYMALNVRFNQAMVYYFERGSFWYGNLFFSFYGLALLTAVGFYKKENIYFKITALLYLAEFLMRGFYFAPHPNYYTLLTMLAAMLLSVWVKVLMPRHKIICLVLIAGLFFRLHTLLETVDRSSARFNSYEYYKLADYIHKNSAPDDYLMNGYDKNFNIYRPDASYYWFGLDMLLPIMEAEFNIKNRVDVNTLIVKYRPKFIYAADYPDLHALRTYGERKFSQKFIPELVGDLYQETPFENLLILK